MPPKSDDESVKVGDNFVASFDVEILKAEESADGKKGHVVALVSVYNLDYTMGWRAKHRVLDGAFSASIASQPAVPIFWQHNWSWSEQPPIGTGIASEQGRGLQVAADFFLDTEAGRSVFNAIAAGALKQWSIGYRVMKYSVEETDDGFDIIHIQEAELLEASSVLRGANPETDTLLVAGEQIPKALQEALDAIGDFMQAQKGANDALAARLDVIEEAHEMLVDTFVDDGASEAARAKLGLTSTEDEAESKSGEAVEPAERGGGEDSQDAAPGVPSAPASPEVVERIASEEGVCCVKCDGDEKRVATHRLLVSFIRSKEGEISDVIYELVCDEHAGLVVPEPAKPADGPVDLDDLVAKAEGEVVARHQKSVELAAIGLGEQDSSEPQVNDLDAIARVMRATNKVRHLWDATERRTEAESLI